MSEIIIVRHGQAQTGAKDEASYDKLSDLGHVQAAWLGSYWAEFRPFDRVLSGTMRRQIETGQSLGLKGASYAQDNRLNEMDYFGLSTFLKKYHDLAALQVVKNNFRLTFEMYWERGRGQRLATILKAMPFLWTDFELCSGGGG
jgi:broad specificity phosphatase PhoE